MCICTNQSHLFWFCILNFVGTTILRIFPSARRYCFPWTLLLQISDLCSIIDTRVRALKMKNIISYRRQHHCCCQCSAQIEISVKCICVICVKGAWPRFLVNFVLQCLRNAFLKINRNIRVSRRDISMIQSSQFFVI